MKQVFMIYAVLIAALACWWIITKNEWFKPKDPSEKQKALKISKHSKSFNESLDKSLDKYFKISSAFSSNDTVAADKNANELLTELNSLNLDELKNDTAGIYETAASKLDDTKGSLQQMIEEAGIDAKKKDFATVSDNIYTFLNSFRYDGSELYWLECQNALGENSSGFWLSKEEKSENPYGQKDCGTVRKKMNVPPKN